MSSLLLTTKLHIPPPRPGLIARPRLVQRLEAGLVGGQKLALLSAPAGFGKTTLLSEWIHDRGAGPAPLRVAWLSLDEGDNDPHRFLAYLITALQTVEEELGKGVLAALQTPGAAEVEAALTPLLNEIAEIEERIVLVLDDYQVVESRPIDRALAFLLAHLPPAPGGLHLVIASRTDPALPLARLRARGQLTELRQADLRFSHDEMSAFLKLALTLPLSADDLRTLESRTEGWITGLQLAAVAMQGLEQRAQVRQFIQSFGGSHRYIIDYLVDEVLEQQTPEIQAFLLQTSILERLAAPLCDAVCLGADRAPGTSEGSTTRFDKAESRDCQALLEEIEAANLFLIPLDDERRWYRYHPLFAGLLRQRLAWASPERMPDLHRRASAWYEQEGDVDDAFRHARAAGDTGRAAGLLEAYWQEIVHRGELAKLEHMLDSLGSEATRTSAPLSMAYCWIHALRGEMAPIRGHLRDIRALWEREAKMGASRQPLRAAVIPSLVETMEAILALEDGQAKRAKEHAGRAIALIPDGVSPASRGLLHGAAGYRLALAHKELGEYDQACARLIEVLEMLKASENYVGAAGTVVQITTMYAALGRGPEGIKVCQDTLAYMEEHGWQGLLPTGMVHLALASLQVDVGELEEARRNLGTGRELVEPIGSRDMLNLVGRVDRKLEDRTAPSQPLVEPLSPRELEVLQLIAEGCSNREIGERLYLAMNTVKGHNRRIYGKLQVQRRTEAVARARELGLLDTRR